MAVFGDYSQHMSMVHPAARYADNHQPFTAGLTIDANSLYLHCISKALPCGYPILFKASNIGNLFTKHNLLTGTSLMARKFFYMEEALLTLKYKHPIRIQTRHFRGEKKVFEFIVDGYLCVDGINMYIMV